MLEGGGSRHDEPVALVDGFGFYELGEAIPVSAKHTSTLGRPPAKIAPKYLTAMPVSFSILVFAFRNFTSRID
jgi:hypothetical protein